MRYKHTRVYGHFMCLLLAIAVANGVGPLCGATGSTLIFEPPKEPLVLTFDPKSPYQAQGQLSVLNNSKSQTLTPQYQLGSVTFKTSNNEEVPARKVLRIEVIPSVLPPGGSQSVVLILPIDNLAPGVYNGYLLIGNAGKEVARRRFQVTIPAKTAMSSPLTSTLSIRAYRWFPFWTKWSTMEDMQRSPLGCLPDWNPKKGTAPSCDLWFSVPLREPLAAQAATPFGQNPVAALIRDPTGTTLVYWDQDLQALRNIPPQGGFRFTRPPHVGKFQGTLTFGTAREKDKPVEVSLILHATDAPLLPLLVLIGSVGLAGWAKQYLNGGRQFLLWQAQERALDASFQQAQQQYATLTAGTPAAGFSLSDDFAKQRQSVRQQLAELRANFTRALDASDPNYQQIEADFNGLKKALDQWVKFGANCQNLAQLSAQLPDDRPGLPLAIRHRAVHLLTGHPMLLADLSQAITDCQDAARAIGIWRDLWSQLEGFKTQSDQFQAVHRQDLTRYARELEAMKSALSMAWQKLWSMDGSDGDALSEARRDVQTVQTALMNLLSAAGDLSEPLAAVVNVSPSAPTAVVVPAVLPVATKRFESHIRRQDRALGLLAYVLAVATGLSANYFGKDFGTFHDYLNLFLWAVGTKAVLDTFAGAIERLAFARRTPPM